MRPQRPQRGLPYVIGPLGGAFLKPRPLGVDSYFISARCLSVLCYADTRAYIAYGNSKDDLAIRTEVQELKNGVPKEIECVRAFLPKDENERQKSGQVAHVYTVPVCREPRHETPLSVAPSNRHLGAQGDPRPEDLGSAGRTSPALGLLVRMSPSQEG